MAEKYMNMLKSKALEDPNMTVLVLITFVTVIVALVAVWNARKIKASDVNAKKRKNLGHVKRSVTLLFLLILGIAGFAFYIKKNPNAITERAAKLSL
jgi:hypothetical protein